MHFEVPEAPVPQPRQRFGVRNGKAVPMKDRKDKRAKIDGFKNAVKGRGLLSRSREWPLGEPGWGYRLLCVFHMPPPLDLPKTRTGFTVCPTKPDLDNMVKAVKDALTGVLWADDGAVFDEQAVKVYPPPGGKPAVLVVVQAVKFSRRAGLSAECVDSAVDGWRSQVQLFEG